MAFAISPHGNNKKMLFFVTARQGGFFYYKRKGPNCWTIFLKCAVYNHFGIIILLLGVLVTEKTAGQFLARLTYLYFQVSLKILGRI